MPDRRRRRRRRRKGLKPKMRVRKLRNSFKGKKAQNKALIILC